MQSSACGIWIKAWCADTYSPNIPILQLSVLHLRIDSFILFRVYSHTRSVCTFVCTFIKAKHKSLRDSIKERRRQITALQEDMIFAWKLSRVWLPGFWVKLNYASCRSIGIFSHASIWKYFVSSAVYKTVVVLKMRIINYIYFFCVFYFCFSIAFK